MAAPYEPKTLQEAIVYFFDSTNGQIAVVSILEHGKDDKHSTVRTAAILSHKKKAFKTEVCKHVNAGAALCTNELHSYKGRDEFQYEVVDQRHVCFGRAIPSISQFRRANCPIQQSPLNG